MTEQPRQSLSVRLAAIAGVIIIFVAMLAGARDHERSQQRVTPRRTGIFDSEPIWTYDSPEEVISTPIVDDGRVFVRTTNTVQVLDASSGKQVSVFSNIPSRIGTPPPMVYQGGLFVPDKDGTLVAYKLDSSSVWWIGCSRRQGCPSFWSVNKPHASIESMTHSENVLVVTRFDTALTAYDITTGAILWEKLVDRSFRDIHVKDSVLYSGAEGSIIAYDIQSGQPKWSHLLEMHGRFVLDDNMMYMVTDSEPTTNVAAFDTIKRNIIWESQISTRQATIDTYLALGGDILIVSSDSVVAIDVKTGDKLWETDRINNMEQAIISGKIVLVRDWDTQLFAFDIETGKQIGGLPLRNKAPRSDQAELNPAVMGDMLIAPIGAKQVTAFNLPKP